MEARRAAAVGRIAVAMNDRDIIQHIEEQVDEIVFVSPSHAVVKFELVSTDPIVPRDHIGEAVLKDGRWVMAIATSCDLYSLAGVPCDPSKP